MKPTTTTPFCGGGEEEDGGIGGVRVAVEAGCGGVGFGGRARTRIEEEDDGFGESMKLEEVGLTLKWVFICVGVESVDPWTID